MHSEFVEELLTSLKGLYKSALYSDLVVQCGDTKHNVHQAVVYPRAQNLKKEVDNGIEGTSKKDKNVDYLDLSEDDPQAVELLLHYLYHLDYPHIPSESAVSSSAAANIIESKVNGINGHNETASTNGAVDETAVNGGGGAKLAPEYSIEKEAFIQRDASTVAADEVEPEVATSKKAMKKKKKRAMSIAPVNGVETATNGTTTNGDVHVNGNGTTAPTITSPQSPKTNGIHAVQPISTPNNTTEKTATSPIIQSSKIRSQSYTTPSSSPSSPNLTIHARLYSLATKYSVHGLRSLSSQKFTRELAQFWQHDDFLTAAQEAYTSTDRSDRVLRDAVLGAIKLHQDELLRRKEVQDVIRGLELSFDLLMVMHGGNTEDRGAVSAGKGSLVNGSGGNGVVVV